MKYRRSDYAKYATLTSIALALTLVACIPAGPEASTSFTPAASADVRMPVQAPVAPVEEQVLVEERGSVTVSVPIAVAPVVTTPAEQAPVSSPPPSIAPVAPATPAVTPPPAAPVVTPNAPATPAAPPVSPGYQNGTFTFPDGHISFDVPTGWTVQLEQGRYNENAIDPGVKENSLAANIFDETGGKVAHITSGGTGELLSGPVNRTILDSQELTAFDSRDGASHFAFIKDDYPTNPLTVRYYMGVVVGNYMTEGPDSLSVDSFMIMPNGLATAVAHIDASMTPETAKAWMKTDQYVKLRAMLTSLRYTP